MNLNTGTVKLTDLASCGGCAAKYSAARLEQLLAGFCAAFVLGFYMLWKIIRTPGEL